jgi:hypothetical protein
VLRDGHPSEEISVERVGATGFQAQVPHTGRYELLCANGAKTQAEVSALPADVLVQGPWTVRFPPGMGAPPQLRLNELISWSEHADPDVRYFSGRATYLKDLVITQSMLRGNRRVLLDLGQVEVIARVTLNGNELGIAWKPPYIVDITDAARAGTNRLEISVVNLWPNRMIGDAQLPEDAEWVAQSFGPLQGFGASLAKWPAWLQEGQPSPTGRRTFATWKVWAKDAPLLKSGLLGPVRLTVVERIEFAPAA